MAPIWEGCPAQCPEEQCSQDLCLSLSPAWTTFKEEKDWSDHLENCEAFMDKESPVLWTAPILHLKIAKKIFVAPSDIWYLLQKKSPPPPPTPPPESNWGLALGCSYLDHQSSYVRIRSALLGRDKCRCNTLLSSFQHATQELLFNLDGNLSLTGYIIPAECINLSLLGWTRIWIISAAISRAMCSHIDLSRS